MAKLNDVSKEKNGGKTFMEATPEQRLALLQTLDKEQFDFLEKRKDRSDSGSRTSFFRADNRIRQHRSRAEATNIVDESA